MKNARHILYGVLLAGLLQAAGCAKEEAQDRNTRLIRLEVATTAGATPDTPTSTPSADFVSGTVSARIVGFELGPGESMTPSRIKTWGPYGISFEVTPQSTISPVTWNEGHPVYIPGKDTHMFAWYPAGEFQTTQDGAFPNNTVNILNNETAQQDLMLTQPVTGSTTTSPATLAFRHLTFQLRFFFRLAGDYKAEKEVAITGITIRNAHYPKGLSLRNNQAIANVQAGITLTSKEALRPDGTVPATQTQDPLLLYRAMVLPEGFDPNNPNTQQQQIMLDIKVRDDKGVETTYRDIAARLPDNDSYTIGKAYNVKLVVHRKDIYQIKASVDSWGDPIDDGGTTVGDIESPGTGDATDGSGGSIAAAR